MTTPYYKDDLITIYHGDCTDIVPELGRFDLLLTDPPYGNGQNIPHFPNKDSIYNNSYAWNDTPIDGAVLSGLIGVTENQIIWGGNYFPSLWIKSSRGFIFWDKVQTGLLHADGEMAWTSFDKNAKMYRYCFTGNRFGEDGNMKGVGKKSNRVHPTQKPEALMNFCIQYADNPQSILDPFMGSGTTLVAARRNAIRAVGIDTEEKYCEIAARRVQQLSLFEAEGAGIK